MLICKRKMLNEVTFNTVFCMRQNSVSTNAIHLWKTAMLSITQVEDCRRRLLRPAPSSARLGRRQEQGSATGLAFQGNGRTQATPALGSENNLPTRALCPSRWLLGALLPRLQWLGRAGVWPPGMIPASGLGKPSWTLRAVAWERSRAGWPSLGHLLRCGQ